MPLQPPEDLEQQVDRLIEKFGLADVKAMVDMRFYGTIKLAKKLTAKLKQLKQETTDAGTST
jgi:hypothetical protein